MKNKRSLFILLATILFACQTLPSGGEMSSGGASDLPTPISPVNNTPIPQAFFQYEWKRVGKAVTNTDTNYYEIYDFLSTIKFYSNKIEYTLYDTNTNNKLIFITDNGYVKNNFFVRKMTEYCWDSNDYKYYSNLYNEHFIVKIYEQNTKLKLEWAFSVYTSTNGVSVNFTNFSSPSNVYIEYLERFR